MDQQTQLVTEFLRDERKKDRKSVYFKYSVIAALGLSYLAIALVGVMPQKTSPDKPYAALVRLNGEILPGKDGGAHAINPLLARAFADEDAKGVVVVINSPGGTPVQSALIHDQIKLLKEKHNKPVVVVGEDMLTSGAYMVAVAADHIVVNRSTVVGSIGVISRGFGFTRVMEKLGVERRVLTAGESKNMLDPFTPQTAKEKEKQGELLKAIHTHFKEVVTTGRGDRLNLSTDGLFSGTVWTGEVAVQQGLADKLGDVDFAVKELLKAEVTVEYRPNRTLVDSIVGQFGVAVANALSPQLQAAVPLAMPN